MKWEEFQALLVGISPDTALGRIVAIRSEDDEDILKHFNKEQRRIRSEWRARHAQTVTKNELQKALEGFKNAFISMAGGDRH